MKRAFSGAVVSLALMGGSGCARLERYEFREPHMGTEFRIVLYAADGTVAEAAATAAFARVRDLDDKLSDYEPESELNRLIDFAPGKPVAGSDDLLDVLMTAQEVARRSDGAFDVTVGPLVRLWRRSMRRRALPPESMLAEARGRVGHRHLVLDGEARTVTLVIPRMQLDLGGIAKGYAVEEAMASIRGFGIERALVDGGGDIAVGAAPPGRPGWRIGIESTMVASAVTPRAIVVEYCAVATSGDRFRFTEIDGVRYSHIVDPRTGVGVPDGGTVTVVAPDGALADALASAVSVLGREAGLELVASYPESEVLVLGGNSVTEPLTSPGFPEVQPGILMGWDED